MGNYNLQPLEVDLMGSYEAEKIAHKNSPFLGLLVFTKGSLGAGIFMYQYYFIKAGFLPGVFFTALTIGLINCFLALLSKLADKVEYDKDVQIETLDELTNIVLGRSASILIKALVILLNAAVILANTMFVVGFIITKLAPSIGSETLTLPWLIKLIFIIVLHRVIFLLFFVSGKYRLNY